MSAVQSATITVNRLPASHARLHTYVVATVAVAIGTLAVAVVMTLSILLAAPASSFGAAPAPQTMAQPSAPYGLDR